MLIQKTSSKIDYLVIGHLSLDIMGNQTQIGGTAAYAALTAKALGLKVGMVTSWINRLPPKIFDDIEIINLPSDKPTTFENIYTPDGRVQVIHSLASTIRANIIPESWLDTPIVHLGPIAQEIEPSIVRMFPNSFLGLTPQGWLREFDDTGKVFFNEWPEARFILEHASAVVLSDEDVLHDTKRIEEFAQASNVLVITKGPNGAVVYQHGNKQSIPAQQMEEIDSTGAGDIFAASFFFRLHQTSDPYEAARFANTIAAFSIGRSGLSGVPTPSEVSSVSMEVY